MSGFCDNGYLETIEAGLSALPSFRFGRPAGAGGEAEAVRRLAKELESADAIVIGAGAGLSAAAGLAYSGERFEKLFGDFAARFGIRDIYSGGFHPFPDEETRWAWWARHIYYNRYVDPPKPTYRRLLSLLRGRDYFVVTTNVDGQFPRAGFDKERLFATQGDYGLFQSADPSNRKTWNNENWVMRAMEAQGFEKDASGVWRIPRNGVSMRIPTALVPKCPDDGTAATTNLRVDDSFVEDGTWRKASAAYADFLRRHKDLRTLYLEIGVGSNTPVVVKYPFWAMTAENRRATYACVNLGEALCPLQIANRSICINGDADAVRDELGAGG